LNLDVSRVEAGDLSGLGRRWYNDDMSQDRTSRPPETLASLRQAPARRPDRLTALSPQNYPMDSNAAIMGAGLELAHGYQRFIGSRFPSTSSLNLGDAGGFTPEFRRPELQPALHARADPNSAAGRRNFQSIAAADTRALNRPESDPITRQSGSRVSTQARANALSGGARFVNFMNVATNFANPFGDL
jgi:hypothetical protein